MKNYFKVMLVLFLVVSLISCGGNNTSNEDQNELIASNNQVEAKDNVSSKKTNENNSVKSDLVKCGQVYESDNLSFNVLETSVENNILRLKLEVYNHSNEDVNFGPMDTLTVYDDNNKECSWNMMIGDLNGVITPQNKIMGDVGFDIEDTDADSFVLHIGSSFEYKPAIEINSSDIGQSFSEAFESSGVKSEYGIGDKVESDQFDMTILGASTIKSEKEGKDILLIHLSIKNNDSESRSLSLELDGVFTADGQALTTEVNEWTFPNWSIDSGDTAEGIVSYYCESGETDFYMTVKPNLRDYTHSETIVFTADTSQASSQSNEGAGSDLISRMGFERPQTMKIISEMSAFGSTTVMTTYYDGDKSRTEVDIPGMPKSIMIHVPNREVMYQYVYGESTGVKITGADIASAQEMGMMMDTSLLEALVDGSSEDINAKVDYLDGEEVIYIEATQSDEDMGEMLVKMWYSERYATPLKYEVYAGDALIIELNVTKIHDNVNFAGDTFMPPEDITFEEIDMETLMKNW